MPREAGWNFFCGPFLALALLWFSACGTVPVTGRSQFNLIPASTERAMGRDAFNQMKADTPLSQNAADVAMVQRVGRRISEVAATHLPQAQWEFVLFEKSEANAFCLPGGKVGVNTGILPITQNEAGLAVVLAHEVAHAAAHHSAERVSRMLAIQGIGIAAISSLSNVSASMRNLLYAGYGIGTTVGTELPHGRAQELEADAIGLVYMAHAGYDPAEAVRFWERFAEYNKQKGSNTPWFLRTHPLDQQRIDKIKQLLPKARSEYANRRVQVVTLITAGDGSERRVPWKRGITLYSARRTAGLTRVAGKPLVERDGKTYTGKPTSVLLPGDVVRWK